jgi:GNAT superfamily N-acetyltransferase
MSFNGLMTPALFVMGEKDGVRTLLTRTLRLPQVHLTLQPAHRGVVESVYATSEVRQMFRMHVDRQSFMPSSIQAVRLHSSNLSDLNALYAWGGPGFFAAYQLEQGIYYGALADGKLIAAAGTHVVAPEYGIAAVGNVYTHPEYRGRGLAKACTSAVTAALLDMGCLSVVLNVRQDNAPALQAYQRLGYAVHCPYIEARGQRRSAAGQFINRFVPQKQKATPETYDIS